MYRILFFIIAVFSCTIIGMAQENTATIYIIQKSSIPPITGPKVAVNNMLIGKLPNRKYIKCIVPAGNISISLFESTTGKSNEISFKAAGKSTYYLQATLVAKSQQLFAGQTLSHTKMHTQSYDVNINLSWINAQVGEQMIKKFKEVLYTDLSELNIFENENYANAQTLQVQESVPQAEHKKPILTSDVDINIPETKTQSKNTFALIIANEEYTFVDNVEYALNDGKSFREYCIKTLGIPERQVWLYENASLGIISSGVNKLVQAINIFKDARAIIYYCGHGIPDEKTSDAYIIPVDGKGTDVSSCYSLNKLYTTMSSANASSITYFMDACFTGANRDGSMLIAARGVAREPKKEELKGNTVVFSAASGDETAMPYKEKCHGLFTYFLLKKLQDTKGEVSLGELAEFINSNVQKEAFLTNEKPQSPVVATSKELAKSWREINMK